MKQNGSSIALILAFIVVVLLFLFLGGGMATGGMMGGGMMGGGMMGGSWLWLPTLLTLGVGILLGWVIFGKK